MKYNAEIRRSNRKTVAIQITQDRRVILRGPLFMTDQDAERILSEKSDYIEKHLAELMAQAENEQPKLSMEEINRLADNALKAIPPRLAYFASIVGVTYGKVTVRNQVSRWGSCSAKGNLNFNCLLMLCPPEILDYVIVHELCHRKHMNHSKDFWAEVEWAMPDYKEREKWLKDNGGAIIRRMR